MKLSTLAAFTSVFALAVALDEDDFNPPSTADISTPDFVYTTHWASLKDCVAQDAFNSCIAPLSTTNQTCTSNCSNSSSSSSSSDNDDDDYDDDSAAEDCHESCDCAVYTGQLNCALEFCWNRVYGCDYQKTAMNLLFFCNMTANEASIVDESPSDTGLTEYGIPYFPAPSNASDVGECSCNIPVMNMAVSDELLRAFGDSCGNADTADDLNQTCTCCAYSGAYST